MVRFSIIKVILSGALVFSLALLITSWDIQWDLTSDSRYTLSPLAKQMVRTSEDPIVITILLEGSKIPASFRNYRSYIDYYVSELRRYDRRIEIIYKDPSEGDIEEATSFKKFLSSRGVEPIQRQAQSGDELNINPLYPYLSVHNDKEIIFIDLLEPQMMGEAEEQSLLRSQLAFEGKFLRAIRQLTKLKRPEVHLLGYRPSLVADGYNRDERLGGYHFVASNADLLLSRADSAAAVIAILKIEDLVREELLAIDVVAGSGVPVIWLIDKFDVTIDSLRNTGDHLAVSRDFLAEDYLFRTGVRLVPELILDIQSSFIPQVINERAGTPETRMMKYPYHPVIIASDGPPSVKLSSPLALYFASPIEFLEYPKSIMKEVLLETSPYTKKQPSPVLIDFGMMKVAPQAEEYQRGHMSVAVKIEGRITPYFKNRLMGTDQEKLKQTGMSYSLDSQYIQQVVVSDADFALPATGTRGFFPVGYNPIERQMYDANTQLLSNLLESMIDGDEILSLSQKTTTVALLDSEKYHMHSSQYYLILLALPLTLLLISYLSYHWYRKRRYAT